MAERTRANKGGSHPLEVAFPSKVDVPPRQPAIVRRERLIESISQIANRRVGVVTAQAGYGKTTLLLDLVASWPDPVCWYSLDEGDADPSTFFRYLLAAGRKQFPDFGRELAAALETGVVPSSKDLVELLASATAAVGRPCLFVLDDFHFLDDAADDLRQTLAGWLYRLPPGTHVILSGRTRPQLPVLPMMAVRQEIVTIDVRDFAFTCEEVAHLYRDVLSKDISLDDAQYLADLTEGWAGALVLLADRVHASRTMPSLEQLAVSDTLFQYMSLEQFDPLPPDLQGFLQAAAVLQTMHLDAVNDLLDSAGAEEELGLLVQRNLVTPPVAGSDGGYRFNRLFRAFLVSHLRLSAPESFRRLHLKAAELMERAQRWPDAVYHYIQISAWEHIVDITERVGTRLFEEGKWDTLGDWLEAVPQEALAAQPKLVLWKARILHYLNQVDRTLALINTLVAELGSSGDNATLGEALVIRGMALRVRGDFQEARDALSRACTLLSESDAPPSALTDARKELGITLGMFGEFANAVAELRSVLGIYEAQGDTYNIAHVSDQLGNAYMAVGRLSESINALENARRLWVKLGNEQRLSLTLNNLGFAYYLGGDYDNAGAAIREGLETVRRNYFPRAEVYLLKCLGDMQRDGGEQQAALQTYQEALDVVSTLDEAYIRIYLMDAVANTHRLLGDVAAGENWSNRALADAEARGGSFEIGFCTTTLGLLQRDRGDLKEAAATIERAANLLKASDAERELASAYFHLAGIQYSLKRKRLALDCVEQAAVLVKSLGYDHFLRLEAARSRLLVQYAAANKVGDGYYAGLLKVLAGESSPGVGDDGESTDGALLAFGFGHPRVEVNGREVTDLEWRSEKSREMFFFFLCNRRPLRKEEIITALWPDMPEEKTTSAFHSNMYRLRQALYQDVVAKDSGRYILDPQGRFMFDVENYQQALLRVDAAARGSPEATSAMEKAVSLYKGQFAPDFYSEWAENLRWQVEEQHMGLLAALSEAYNNAGEFKKSADICQRILEVDEFNEAGWYRLLANYVQSGQSEAARYCYNRYVQVIKKDGLEEEDVPGFDELVGEMTAGNPRL